MRPKREALRKAEQSYFVSFQTDGRKPFFRHDRWAALLLHVLENYRSSYLLHAYVLMPDHIHLLLTPLDSLEKAVQLIKGGFSFRAKKELEWQGEIWQRGFSDHRIRDDRDWTHHLEYIQQNPVKAGFCVLPEEYRYSFCMGELVMDTVPQRLKPLGTEVLDGRAEARPLQPSSQALHFTANNQIHDRSMFPSGNIEVRE